MNGENTQPPHVKFWLSPDSKHDCYFIVGPQSGLTQRIGSFKAFLMGHSEPFRVMLQDSEQTEQGDISIVDIQPDTFIIFLESLYMNCDNITRTNLTLQECVDLLYVADKYLVNFVKEKLVECLLSTLQREIKLDDIFTALSSPSFLHEERLEKMFCKIVKSKIKHIFSSPSFLNISSDSLLWILKLDDKIADEITLWQELLKWAIHKTSSKDGSVLRQVVLKHLKFIRFCIMSFIDFCEKVVPTNILTHTEVYDICKWIGMGGRDQQIPNMEFICNNTSSRKESRDDAIFSYCLNNISDLNEEIKSPEFTLEGLYWKIALERVGEFLSFYLDCQSDLKKCTSFTEDHEIELILINHSGNMLSKSVDLNEYVITDLISVGFREFCLWDEIMSPSKNYVLFNSITVAVRIFKH